MRAARLPITLGHEAVGVVTEVGPEVRAVEPGRRMALFPAAVCVRWALPRFGGGPLNDRTITMNVAKLLSRKGQVLAWDELAVEVKNP